MSISEFYSMFCEVYVYVAFYLIPTPSDATHGWSSDGHSRAGVHLLARPPQGTYLWQWYKHTVL